MAETETLQPEIRHFGTQAESPQTGRGSSQAGRIDNLQPTKEGVASTQIRVDTQHHPSKINNTANHQDRSTNLHSPLRPMDRGTTRTVDASYLTNGTNRNSLPYATIPSIVTRAISSHTITGTNSTNTTGVNLSMQTINVCGLRRKLDIKEFRDTLQRYNISFLCETKLDDMDIDIILDIIDNLGLKDFFQK